MARDMYTNLKTEARDGTHTSRMGNFSMTFRRLVAAAALTAAAATPALAQQGGKGYLFHEPMARITIRGGYDHATAGSDIFDEVTQNLTLRKGDFSSGTFGADVAF